MVGGTHTLDWHRESEVLVIRHPQTMANVQGRFLGRGYAPLTELGEAQRRRAVEALVAYAPDRLLSSPLDRCLGIARPVAERCGIGLEVCDDLTEMDFGAIEGHEASRVVAEGFSLPWGPTADGWPVAGAETMEELRIRTARVAARVAEMDGRVAIVSHGGAIRGLLSAWLGIDRDEMWEFSVLNVCSSIVGFDETRAAYLVAHGLEPEQVPVHGTAPGQEDPGRESGRQVEHRTGETGAERSIDEEAHA